MNILTRVPIIFIIALLLLASCGKRQQAKGVVKDFIEAYAAEEIDITSFSDLDSTHAISDSMLHVLRDKAQRDPLFKKVELQNLTTSNNANRQNPTLLFIRMRYRVVQDTLEQWRTFYFDPDLSGIIAFK